MTSIRDLSASGKIAGTAILFAIALFSMASSQQQTLNRDSIPDKYKWDLSHIYPGWDDWEADFARADSMLEYFKTLKGTLSSGPKNLWRVYNLRDEIDKLMEKVSAYAGLSFATDTRNNETGAKSQRRRTLLSKARIAQSWLRPELLTLSWDSLGQWLAQHPELEPYRLEIENEFRRRNHILDHEQEQLLSYFSTFQGSPASVYSALTTADIDYPIISLDTGEEVKLTDGRYINLISTDRNQQERAMAFDSFITTYGAYRNTHAAIYNSILQRDWATAQARNYSTTLEMFLDGDNVPSEIYENLVETVKKGSDPIKRYFNLKKEVLGLDAHHMYDRYVPIIDYQVTYKYDDIIDWIVASVEPFGPLYQAKVRTAFEDRWIDVYENDGKYGGGFCSGAYGVHPYILINYNETAREMFTVAHEMGHAMHSVLAEENQPYATSDYSIFVAEVASTANEQLLLHYLLDRTPDPRERIFLLQNYLDGLRGTFYRQVLFADFEWRAHQLVENGQPITADGLHDLFLDVVEDFYGDTMAPDSLLGYYWSVVPHFHSSPYYVYKYATSYAAATHLVNEILAGDEVSRDEAVERYLTLLKSGGSDYPMELLKKAGVDLSNPETIQAIISVTDELVTQLENELAKL